MKVNVTKRARCEWENTDFFVSAYRQISQGENPHDTTSVMIKVKATGIRYTFFPLEELEERDDPEIVLNVLKETECYDQLKVPNEVHSKIAEMVAAINAKIETI
jgi:hypothetical protein